MKVVIELDIPRADYVLLTKWLKYHVPQSTVENTLQYGAEMDVQRFLTRAREHMKTGKSALERFRDGMLKKEDNDGEGH